VVWALLELDEEDLVVVSVVVEVDIVVVDSVVLVEGAVVVVDVVVEVVVAAATKQEQAKLTRAGSWRQFPR
jgi:hypothetical protein